MKKFNLIKSIPFFIILIFGVLLFSMAFLNHYYFRTVSCDYANYNFAFWDYSHFRVSMLPSYDSTFLQDHFSLTLMYFIPVYWLLDWLTGTYTLLLIQYSLVLIAAWYTYKLVFLKSNNIWLGVAALIYYFTLLGRYTTFACDVNLAVISACFIPLFLYAFETRKYFTASLIFVLSLFSRENIPIWFIFIFVVLIIQHWRDKKAVIYSLCGIGISILYFILLFKVLIPSVETPEHKFVLFNYSAMGENPGEAFRFALSHPIEIIKLFFINHLDDPSLNRVKLEFYLVYIISGGFILFLRPQYLIWFIPVVAQKVLNDSFIRWGIATYYSVEVVTLLPLAVFLTLSSLKKKKVQYSLSLLACCLTIGMTIYKLNPKNCELPWTMNPEKQRIYDKQFFTSDFDVKKVNQLLSLIPDDAKVSASNHIQPHLAQRLHNYFFPIVKDADYIVFSVFDDSFIYSQFENNKSRKKYFTDSDWKIIAEEFPVFLFRKKTSEQKQSDVPALKKEFVLQDTLYCDYEQIDEVGRHVLFSTGEKADTILNVSETEPVEGRFGAELTKENPYSHSVLINDLNLWNYIEVSVWCHCKGDQTFIVASGEGFYLTSNEGEENTDGWKKLVLGFWVTPKMAGKDLSFYLWNNSPEPAFFDNLLIQKSTLR